MLDSRLSQLEVEKWVVVSWTIWNAWNKFYFEQIQLHWKAILDDAIGYLEEYQRLINAQRKS